MTKIHETHITEMSENTVKRPKYSSITGLVFSLCLLKHLIKVRWGELRQVKKWISSFVSLIFSNLCRDVTGGNQTIPL